MTALVTNHNYGRFLAAAIDSALAQSHTPLEVLVVDDGSSDASREILAGYGARIRTILKQQGGQASAFNAGFAAARGELICFLDADDLWFPDKVARVVEAHREGPALVCHDLTLAYEDGQTGPASSWCLATNTSLARGSVIPELLARGAGWQFSPTSGMSITRAVAQALAPLPEVDWPICADNPVAYGAAWLGVVGALEQALGVYRVHGSNQFLLPSSHESWIIRFRGVEDPARRLAYLKDFVRRHGGEAPDLDLRDRYFYCREWSLLTRPLPVLDLPRLWRAKLRERPARTASWLSLPWSLVWDTLAAIGISLGVPSPWSELRRRYAPRRPAGGVLPPPLWPRYTSRREASGALPPPLRRA